MVPPVQVSPLIKVNPLYRRCTVLRTLHAPYHYPDSIAGPRDCSLWTQGGPRPAMPPPPGDPCIPLHPPCLLLSTLGRYSALMLGMAYGAKRYSYLKPRAEEERRVAAEEKKRLDELKRIERELAEAQDDSILK
ncbi:ATP synthase subunit e, mitochondrial [Sigmodon hispidus]